MHNLDSGGKQRVELDGLCEKDDSPNTDNWVSNLVILSLFIDNCLLLILFESPYSIIYACFTAFIDMYPLPPPY